MDFSITMSDLQVESGKMEKIPWKPILSFMIKSTSWVPQGCRADDPSLSVPWLYIYNHMGRPEGIKTNFLERPQDALGT